MLLVDNGSSYVSRSLLSQASQPQATQPFQPAGTYPKGDGSFSSQAAGTIVVHA